MNLNILSSLNMEKSYDILTEFIDCSVKSILILLPQSKSIEWLSQPKIFEAVQVASRRGVEVRIIMRDVDEVYKNWDNNCRFDLCVAFA